MPFENIAPYLQNPFVLAGFITMLFIGVVTLLIKKGIIRLTRRDSAVVVNKVLRYGFIIALVAIAAGVVTQLMNASSGSSVAIPDTIKGVVEHHDGSPASGARVELLAGETPMVTNSDNNGRFEFKKPATKTAEIKIVYANKELIQNEIDIENAVKSGLFYKLPQVKTPFSITYLKLDPLAIHFLVKGSMEELSEQIFKNTKVIPNEVYQDVKSIYESGMAVGGPDYFILNGETKSLSDKYKDGVRVPARESLYGGGQIFNADYSEEGLSELALAVVENGDWGVYAYHRDFYEDESFPNNLYISPDSFYTEVLWRFATTGDFNHWAQELMMDVYLKVTENGIVPGFGLITLASYCEQGEEEGCGGGPLYPRLEMAMFLPTIKIQVAKVKNISNEPMFLEQFVLRENDSPTLRYYSDDIEHLEKAKSVKKNLFTQVLEPQHSVLLPLKIYFEYDLDFYIDPDGTKGFIEKINQAARNQINSTSPPVEQIRYGNVILNDGRKIRCPVLVDVADKKRTIPENFFQRKFVYGKSVLVKDIQVDNAIYAARQYDPKRVTIEDGFWGASCPYIFTYSVSQNLWINEGHILYAVNDKSKEKYDERRLFNYNGDSIILKELEPETSYIDHLYIRAVNSSGESFILPAKHELLYQSDSQYLVTKKGDEIKISFNKLPDEFKDAEIFIVAKGYYIPNNRKPNDLSD